MHSFKCVYHCPDDDGGLSPVLKVAAVAGGVVGVWRVLDMIQAGLIATVIVGVAGGVLALALVVRHVRRGGTGIFVRQGSRADAELAAAARQPELDAEQRRALPQAKVVPGVVVGRSEKVLG